MLLELDSAPLITDLIRSGEVGGMVTCHSGGADYHRRLSFKRQVDLPLGGGFHRVFADV
jgi:hypothetical protein